MNFTNAIFPACLLATAACLVIWPVSQAWAPPASDARSAEETDYDLSAIACRAEAFGSLCSPCQKKTGGETTVHAVRSLTGNFLSTEHSLLDALDDKPRPVEPDPREKFVEYRGCGDGAVSALLVREDDTWRMAAAAKNISLATCRKVAQTNGPREFVICEQVVDEPAAGRLVETYAFQDGTISRVELASYRSELSSCETSTYDLSRLAEWRIINDRLVARFEDASGEVPDEFDDLCAARRAGFSVWADPGHHITVFHFARNLHVHAPTKLLGDGFRVIIYPGGTFDHPSLPH